MHNRHKRFTLPQKLIAGIVASGMLATGIGMAFAADGTDPNGTGGGGSGTGSGGTGGSSYVKWIYQESFGNPTVDNAKNALKQAVPGIWIGPAGTDDPDRAINDAVTQANQECVARGGSPCRLVGLGFVVSTTPSLSFTGASGNHTQQDWTNPWNTDIASHMYSRNGLSYKTNDRFGDGTNSVNSLAMREIANNIQSKSVIALVLGDNEPAPPDYRLEVTTDRVAESQYKVGESNPVADTVYTKTVSPQNGQVVNVQQENLQATVWLNVDTDDQFYLSKPKAVSKQVTLPNKGTVKSPDFTPADFGWKTWQKGTYWFDIDVPKQGNMDSPVNTPDRDGREMFSVVEEPPTQFSKTVDKAVSASQMVNTTRIVSSTGRGGYQMTITDRINPNGINYTISNMKVTDLTDKRNMSSQWQTIWDKTLNTVTAVYNPNGGKLPFKDTDMLPAGHQVEFSFDVTVDTPADFKQVDDTAHLLWNHEPEVSTDERHFDTWQPNPDKSWVRWDSKTKRWQTVIDPDRTNATGADRMVFLDGDKVGAVVNGTIPAHLAQAPERIVLTDNYANADYLWDPAESKDMRVFEISADTDRHSSVADIINKGRDVTGQWTVSIDKNTHTITAASSKQYAQAQQNLPQPKQLTVLAPGVVNFANGKGAAQVRSDFDKNPSDELTFCANPGNNPTDTTLTNAGSQTVNNHTVATNEPYICGYVPPVVKDVLAEASQGGDQESVDGKTVYPGQKVEYRLETQPTLPQNLGYTVEQVQIRDTFSPYLTPDKQTVEVTDLASGKIISKKQYQTRWDSKAHQFTLTFGKTYVADNWGSGATPRLLVRFEGTVDEDAPANKTVDNQWQLVLNNSITVSNVVSNTPPTPEPHKADKSVKNRSVSIDGKTLLVGEQGVYQLTLDASDKNTAYKVYRLGMVDDFDERYVKILAHDITVMSNTGRDVSDRFNIQVRDGAVYVFAKTVDTEIPATGETAHGDPQPDNLAEYADPDRAYDPLKDPAIDQSLLGHTYTINLPYTVIDGGKGVVVENTATQITNNVKKQTETVSNPVGEINPKKDVTVKVGGESVDSKAVYLNSDFLYQLDSSVLPANRAYPEIARWGIDDTLNPTVDKLSGQWAVYANADLYKDGQVIAAKGDKLAGSKFDSTKFGGDLFTAELDPETGKVSIHATDLYLQLVSADSAHEQAWRAYIQVKRVKVVEHHENQFTEHVGDQELKSNIVWTYTPDLTPSLHVEKYDVQTGEVLGDRDDVKDALQIREGSVEIGFKITNTSLTDPKTGKGATFTGKNLKLVDKTIAGVGTVEDFKYPENWDSLVLKPGESTVVTGTLKGVNAGDKHTDRVQVTGKPDIECPVSDPDPFGNKTGEMNATCDAPEVSSNTDDWSGYKLSLAQTGAQTASLALVAAVSLLAGVAGLTTLRRRNRARHIA